MIGVVGFTAARVVERAGVSIGSLSQYFPNKAAILFRLRSDEWRENVGRFEAIPGDAAQPPLARLRQWLRHFLYSECAEATLRAALQQFAPTYRDAAEARATRAAVPATLHAFLAKRCRRPMTRPAHWPAS